MPQQNNKMQSHKEYHRDGSIWAKGHTLDGKLAGYWEWFRTDGTLMRSGFFEDGNQIGEWTTYDRNGEIVKVTRMKPGSKQNS